MSSSRKSVGNDSSSSWDSNSNEMDEKHFLRMYSKALAEALKTKEEEEAAEREELKRQQSSRNKSSGVTAADDEKIKGAYRELCHDDPIVTGGDRLCRQLAEVLVPKYKTTATRPTKNDNNNPTQLALSSPLVEGVLQAVKRAGSNATSSSKQSKNSTDETSQKDEEGKSLPVEASMTASTSVTSSEGYAQLAFAVFLEGPYRCIQQDDLDVTCQFLGSFQPPEKTNSTAHEELSSEEKSRLVDEATAKIVDGIEKMSMAEDQTKTAQNNRDDDASSSSSEFFLHKKNNNQAQEDYDSMEEIWAEDSDPDDYEYESSYNPYNAVAGNIDDDNYDAMDGDYFNPMQLSKPINQTWEGARKSIYHLLSSFSYGNMALHTSSSRTWSDLGMSESLGDLAFTLLLANTNGSSDKNSLMWRDDLRAEDVDDITSLWDRPLFALRDRAMDKNCGHDALTVYLQLLCAFLSHSEEDIMSILSSPSTDTNNTNDLPPLTAVGLSSFATLCTSKEMTCSSSAKLCGTSIESVCPRDEMNNAIYNSIDTLARILECVRPKKSVFGQGSTGITSNDNSATASWVRAVVCIIPLIEYLMNVKARFDFQTVFEGGGSRKTALSDSDAKALLDSGLFRELLSLYTCTQNESDASNVVRLQLLRTIFALSVQVPEILGIYAIRVPELVKEVHASLFMDNNLVDGILWTSLGSSLLESKSETPKPRLKLRANAKLNLTPADTTKLSERCHVGFEKLCKSCNTALVSYKEIVDREDHNEEDMDEVRQHKEMLGNIVKFSNYLSHCPHGIKIWLDSLNNNEDAPQKAKVAVADLRSTLARLPSYTDEIGVNSSDHKKDDDIDNLTTDDHSEIRQKATSLRQRRKDFRQVVSLVRSSVKVIALALESQKGAGLSLKTPVSCYNASSKTD